MSNMTDRIAIRLDPDLRRRLEARAAVEDRKPAALARLLIRQGLQATDSAPQEAVGAR
jgi:predicted transcriptional regulator